MTYNEIIKEKEEKIVADALKVLEPFEVRDIIKQQQETINRQQAEIERLNEELKITRAYIHDNGLEWDLLSYSERNGG